MNYSYLESELVKMGFTVGVQRAYMYYKGNWHVKPVWSGFTNVIGWLVCNHRTGYLEQIKTAEAVVEFLKNKIKVREIRNYRRKNG